MDILDAIAFELPCRVSGGRYKVTPKQVMISEHMMRQGCPVPGQFTTEYPPLYYTNLTNRKQFYEVVISDERG